MGLFCSGTASVLPRSLSLELRSVATHRSSTKVKSQTYIHFSFQHRNTSADANETSFNTHTKRFAVLDLVRRLYLVGEALQYSLNKNLLIDINKEAKLGAILTVYMLQQCRQVKAPDINSSQSRLAFRYFATSCLQNMKQEARWRLVIMYRTGIIAGLIVCFNIMKLLNSKGAVMVFTLVSLTCGVSCFHTGPETCWDGLETW